MKQVILSEPGKIEIRDVPVPEPLEGEVVLRVNTALTCGTDLKAYVRGHNLIPMPGPFGHEYSGTISRVGKGIKHFKEGDDVMGVHSAPCMECRYCKKGLYNLCEQIMEKKALGAYAEYLKLPPNVVRHNLFRKPDHLKYETAALLEPFSCVVHPYGNLRLSEIDTALVIGAGPVGLMHLAYLRMKGIKVIISDNIEGKLSMATNMGAAGTPAPADMEAAVRDITEGMGADLVVECTGHIKVWEDAVKHVRRGGMVVLFGGCPAGTSATYDTHRLHYDELTLTGSFHYTPKDVRTAYYSLMDKTVDLSMLITAEFPLEDINKAFSLLEEGKGIKYALKP